MVKLRGKLKSFKSVFASDLLAQIPYVFKNIVLEENEVAQISV